MLKRFDFIKGKLREYIKYNIIGMSNFLISQVFYLTLYLLFKINYLVSYTITTVFSVSASYFFNSKFTFDQKKYSLKKFLLTILAYVCEYLLNMTIILFLVNVIGIKKVFAPAIAPVFSTIPMFFLMRFIIKTEK